MSAISPEDRMRIISGFLAVIAWAQIMLVVEGVLLIINTGVRR